MCFKTANVNLQGLVLKIADLISAELLFLREKKEGGKYYLLSWQMNEILIKILFHWENKSKVLKMFYRNINLKRIYLQWY